MKKLITLILTGLLILSLCGCSALDEMRRCQLFSDGDTVTYQGVTYRKLPHSEELQPEMDYTTTLYVTKPDVPVLLSAFECTDFLSPSVDGDFLVGSDIYCRDSRYEEISKVIREGFTPTKIRYVFYSYDEETYEETMHTYVLTQEQVTALETVTANVEPQVLGEGMTLSRDWTLWLEECSEDLLFCRDSMQLAVAGSTYYLILNTNRETLAFAVPDGMNATFDTITAAYRDSGLFPDFEQYA